LLTTVINFIVETVSSLGYAGIFIMMFLESSFFPFPSEVVMIPAGYLAYKGEMNMYLVILFGILGSLAGALFNYYFAIKLGRTLENLKRFFSMVIPSIITLLITAIIMILALGFKDTELYKYVILKEIIWIVMSAIFIIIYIRRNKAQKAFDNKDFANAKNHLNPIAKYLIPINILLGTIALVLGITLRGF
jgi:membrane protein DedA with SNARE-associated domain